MILIPLLKFKLQEVRVAAAEGTYVLMHGLLLLFFSVFSSS